VTSKRKDQICALLKGIETGDEASVTVVNPSKYIQHNPQTQEGGEGLAALFKRLSKTSPRVNIVRIFSDGDFVFGQTEYDFSGSRVGFEIFRFEGEQTVEHWDNIQSRKGPNNSGHSMVDGHIDVTDIEKTELNRALIQAFVDKVMIDRQLNILPDFVSDDAYTEHNPLLSDGIQSLQDALSLKKENIGHSLQYNKSHRILAEGNFVLSVCEGYRDSVHTSFFDLYRLANGKIVEHWDTSESILPRSEWKNQNGKF
jgi:predicted SnoaL-like aldol condensation-catalyzing enzyme